MLHRYLAQVCRWWAPRLAALPWPRSAQDGLANAALAMIALGLWLQLGPGWSLIGMGLLLFGCLTFTRLRGD